MRGGKKNRNALTHFFFSEAGAPRPPAFSSLGLAPQPPSSIFSSLHEVGGKTAPPPCLMWEPACNACGGALADAVATPCQHLLCA